MDTNELENVDNF